MEVPITEFIFIHSVFSIISQKTIWVVIVNEHNNNDKIVHCLNFELELKVGTNRSKEKFVPAKYAV